jgi:hypothetical protein
VARKSKRDQIWETIRKLPADVDPILAADVALEILVDSAWSFSRECKRLPPAVIRELLRRMPTDATHVYLALAVDADARDAALVKRWARAIQGLADLETINRWDSKPKRDKFRALAKNKHLLPAIQGAAARGENVSNNMRAVLVADGSAESIDALIPHLDVAGSSSRLDALRMLRVHAKDTPALRTLFAELDRDAAKVGSAAHGIANLIGLRLPDTDAFWFTAAISSRVPDGYIAPVQLHVVVDSRKASWFLVDVAKIERGTIAGSTSFTHDVLHHDELRIDRCEPPDVPSWLAAVAKKLKITWDAPYISSNMRGAKREQIARWLVP